MALMCSKLGVTRSGYYAYVKRPRSKRSIANEALIEQIRTIHERSRMTYGSPRVHATLRQLGLVCNRKRIARLMKQNDIVSKMKRKFIVRYRKYEFHRCHPNLLLKRSAPTAVNQVWVGDMTYIRVNGVMCNLAVVMDLYNRKIVGWAFAKQRGGMLAVEALQMAIETQKPNKGLIFHSDQGTDYATHALREFLSKHEITQSMSRAGCCWDNANMESFFHTLKTEMVYFQSFKTMQEAAVYIMDYITFYNSKRIHSSLNYLTPNEYCKLAA